MESCVRFFRILSMLSEIFPAVAVQALGNRVYLYIMIQKNTERLAHRPPSFHSLGRDFDRANRRHQAACLRIDNHPRFILHLTISFNTGSLFKHAVDVFAGSVFRTLRHTTFPVSNIRNVIQRPLICREWLWNRMDVDKEPLNRKYYKPDKMARISWGIFGGWIGKRADVRGKRKEEREQKTDGRQKTKGKEQRAWGRRQRAEDRGRKKEERGQTKDRREMTDNDRGQQRAEDRQRTEDRRQTKNKRQRAWGRGRTS